MLTMGANPLHLNDGGPGGIRTHDSRIKSHTVLLATGFVRYGCNFGTPQVPSDVSARLPGTVAQWPAAKRLIRQMG